MNQRKLQLADQQDQRDQPGLHEQPHADQPDQLGLHEQPHADQPDQPGLPEQPHADQPDQRDRPGQQLVGQPDGQLVAPDQQRLLHVCQQLPKLVLHARPLQRVVAVAVTIRVVQNQAPAVVLARKGLQQLVDQRSGRGRTKRAAKVIGIWIGDLVLVLILIGMLMIRVQVGIIVGIGSHILQVGAEIAITAVAVVTDVVGKLDIRQPALQRP